MGFADARRGYAHPIFKRDGYRCCYCGLDGSAWPEWLWLSWDHLLPPGHPQRDDPAFIVTACGFCNSAANRTRWEVEGKSPQQLVDQKRPVVLAVRNAYREFWEQEILSRPGEFQAEESNFRKE